MKALEIFIGLMEHSFWTLLVQKEDNGAMTEIEWHSFATAIHSCTIIHTLIAKSWNHSSETERKVVWEFKDNANNPCFGPWKKHIV